LRDNLIAMAMNSTLSDFAVRFNAFLYRQHIRRLGPEEIGLAREWSMDLIRREHPQLSTEEAERYYENLINVRVCAVDEWTQRMS
jgi:hypothetical protein